MKIKAGLTPFPRVREMENRAECGKVVPQSQSPISSRLDSGKEGGQDRSFQLIVIGVITGEGVEAAVDSIEEEEREKGEEGAEWNGCSLSHLLSPRITTWTGRKYFAARATSTTTSLNFPQHSSSFLLSIRVRKGKTQLPPFDACMHPNRKVEFRTAHDCKIRSTVARNFSIQSEGQMGSLLWADIALIV